MVETTLDTEEFDEIDIELLEYIEDDFDVSLDTLAERLELSKSAVHYRVNKMKEKGIITGITADLDPVPFGLDMVAITEISVTHRQGYSENIGQEIAVLDGVEQVYYTMGDVDFVAILRVQDRIQMNDVIERIVGIDGVNETSSRFVMDELASNPEFMSNLSPEMKRNLVRD
jgi:DNA-binding Lrp family transcriptional regulator